MSKVDAFVRDHSLQRGGVALLAPVDALRLVDLCRTEGRAILGIDCFTLEDGDLLATDDILDLSQADPEVGYWAAAAFITAHQRDGLRCEMVIE